MRGQLRPEGTSIDVERLVADLRERVAGRRAGGGADDDLLELELEGAGQEQLIRFRPELAYSTRIGVGKALTLMKWAILRLLVHVFDDFARQASAQVRRLDSEVRETRRWAEAAVAAEVEARERAERDLGSIIARVEALERLGVGGRIARLERAAPAPAPAPEVVTSSAAPGGSPVPMDYPSFKARFGGSAEEIRNRQASYVGLLEGRSRVVDLGCGHGELLTLLRERGVPAYGVETEPEFVARLSEQGLDVVEADALAHLAGLRAGAVDGVVASHLVEHLPPAVTIRLIQLAHDALAPDGVLVVETPNPESLVAGSINFHRDPTHLAPVHPDTLAFLCEMAGFARVEVLRLSPAAPERLLPSGGLEGAAGQRLDVVVARLNDLLFGYQDYAVLAWR